MKGAVFGYDWNGNSGYKFAFLACNAFHCGLQNALGTIVVFHTASLLIKEVTSQQMKCSNGPMLMEFAGLTMVPTILKQLA